MAIMYSFCKYFSVRLGSILVAVSSAIQSLTLSGLLFFWVDEEVLDDISKYNLVYVQDILNHIIRTGPTIFLKVGTVFLLFHISTSVLLIYAAIKCNIPLIWPFLFVEFVRLLLLLWCHVTAMIVVKNNSYDLGLLVGLCLLGSFMLLGLYYMWFCVFSLCQCIQELKRSSTTDTERNSSSPSFRTDQLLFVSDFKHVNINKRSSKKFQLFVVGITDS